MSGDMPPKNAPHYAGAQFKLPASIVKTRSRSASVPQVEVSTGTWIATLEERNQKLLEENTNLAEKNRMLVADNVAVRADREKNADYWSTMYANHYKSIKGIVDKYKEKDNENRDELASLSLMLGNREAVIEQLEAQLADQEKVIATLKTTLLSITALQFGGAGSSS